MVKNKMSFEEEFPSLKGLSKELEVLQEGDPVIVPAYKDQGFIFDFEDIQKHCLDKQKVREELDRWGDHGVANEIKKELRL